MGIPRSLSVPFVLGAVLLGAAVAWTHIEGGPTQSARSAPLERLRIQGRQARPIAVVRDKLGEATGAGAGDQGEAGRGIAARTPAQELYDDRAFPRPAIAFAQRKTTFAAFRRVVRRSVAVRRGGVIRRRDAAGWRELGPFTPTVPPTSTLNGGAATTHSGRVTAIAVSPRCTPAHCHVLLGAAGGGVWSSEDALDAHPHWQATSDDIPSTSIGSLAFDPTDPSGNTVYAGTGEANGSGDSEAGIGLYRSSDAGAHWTLVPGSLPVARDRSIAAVAVDPANARHLFIGTAVARHGLSSVQGGRFTPPGAPTLGLYESTDAGATFALVFSKVADTVATDTDNGGDFFRGGVSNLALDRTGLAAAQPTRVFVALFAYGLYRSDAVAERGDASYHPVFAGAGAGAQPNSISARTEFALAPRGATLRIYLGDAAGGDHGPASLYRVDDANVPAATLSAGGVNVGWRTMSDPSPTSAGFASFNFCGQQCNYDMPIYSPPGAPDTVYIGGQMQYEEVGQRSNGRALQRSVDAGAHFTDITEDAKTPPLGIHPDLHAIVSPPGKPDVVFVGEDGGIVRTSGSFVDGAALCDTRGLTGVELDQCHAWLRAMPTELTSLNDGLATLQFQSLSAADGSAGSELLGGTQDNGTWSFSPDRDGTRRWVESVSGDGGQSGFGAGNGRVRMHTYFEAQGDVNFRGSAPTGWDWMADPLAASKETSSFFVPLVPDPQTAGTWFVGLQHVFRTTDDGGARAHLDAQCNELLPPDTFDPAKDCGDWKPLGADLVAGPAADKGTGFVVAIARAPGDARTMWVGTRRGRLYVTRNANAGDEAKVDFRRIDTPAQPRRFVSGIVVDPADARHAIVSFSGYDAYTPNAPGHVFDVRLRRGGAAVWTDIGSGLGDQPVTSIALDDRSGDLYASTDFGVLVRRAASAQWVTAAPGMPPVAVYGLTLPPGGRVVYAATHGRGAWSLRLR